MSRAFGFCRALLQFLDGLGELLRDDELLAEFEAQLQVGRVALHALPGLGDEQFGLLLTLSASSSSR